MGVYWSATKQMTVEDLLLGAEHTSCKGGSVVSGADKIFLSCACFITGSILREHVTRAWNMNEVSRSSRAKLSRETLGLVHRAKKRSLALANHQWKPDWYIIFQTTKTVIPHSTGSIRHDKIMQDSSLVVLRRGSQTD